MMTDSDKYSEELDAQENNHASYVVVDKSHQNKKRLVFGLVFLLILAGISISVLYFGVENNKESAKQARTNQPTNANATNSFPEPESVKPSDVVSNESSAKILALALEGYWYGININGKTTPGHNYYPSNADVSDETWVKANLKVHDGIIKSLKDGTLVYHPNGCKADRPSSMQNKCTSFTIQSEGKEVARSKN